MKVIFLDIDGVIQPPGQQNRFEHRHEITSIAERLDREIAYPGFSYSEFSKSYCGMCDVLAVVFDWNATAVKQVHRLVRTTGAKIVVSSSWRIRGMRRHALPLFAIHDIAQYVISSTYLAGNFIEGLDEQESHAASLRASAYAEIKEFIRKALPNPNPKGHYMDDRSIEIIEWLDRHPEVTSFVVLDDLNLVPDFEGHAICTGWKLTQPMTDEAIRILQREDGPYRLSRYLNDEQMEKVQAWREKNGVGREELIG